MRREGRGSVNKYLCGNKVDTLNVNGSVAGPTNKNDIIQLNNLENQFMSDNKDISESEKKMRMGLKMKMKLRKI